MVDILLANQCWVAPSNLQVKIGNKRDFRTKQYTAKLVYIQTKNNIGFKIDQYSHDGEYLGKKTIYRNQGWAGLYALDCDQSSNSMPIDTQSDDKLNCTKVETEIEKLVCKNKSKKVNTPPIQNQRSSSKCLKSKTSVEKLICNDDELSQKDLEISKAVKQAYKKIPNDQKAYLEVGQNSWLEERNKCKNKACLLTSYNNRLIDLEYINTHY
ncbi:hypothetical protein A7P55_03635 [Acinetobacter sp. Ac_5812]|nr:hypothetical protein [Acinetobacter sp. Ac_5812]